MSKNILDNLFGSKARVKILKFMYRNADNPVGLAELSRRVQESPTLVRKEVELLRELGIIKKKSL